jgi:transposase
MPRFNYEIGHSDWMIIASKNLNSTYYDALIIYRNKVIVDKLFNRLKSSLYFELK